MGPVMYLPGGGGLWGLDPHSYINISLKLTYEHVKNTQKNRPTPTVLFFTNTSLYGPPYNTIYLALVSSYDHSIVGILIIIAQKLYNIFSTTDIQLLGNLRISIYSQDSRAYDTYNSYSQP